MKMDLSTCFYYSQGSLLYCCDSKPKLDAFVYLFLSLLESLCSWLYCYLLKLNQSAKVGLFLMLPHPVQALLSHLLVLFFAEQ